MIETSANLTEVSHPYALALHILVFYICMCPPELTRMTRFHSTGRHELSLWYRNREWRDLPGTR